MTERIVWEADSWLGEVLGRPAFRGRIARTPGSELPPGGFGYLKLAVENQSQIQTACSSGLLLADTNVVFEKAVQRTRIPAQAGYAARWTREDDRPAVTELGRRSFRFSRFHRDPHFTPAQADALKAAWVDNFYAGGRGDRLAVLTGPDQAPVGFVQMLSAPQTWIIDLIAIAPEHQGRGLARQLLAFLEAEAPDEITWLRVGTQVQNLPSVRLYESWGFRLTSAQYVFHAHQEKQA